MGKRQPFGVPANGFDAACLRLGRSGGVQANFDAERGGKPTGPDTDFEPGPLECRRFGAVVVLLEPPVVPASKGSLRGIYSKAFSPASIRTSSQFSVVGNGHAYRSEYAQVGLYAS